MNYLRIQRFKRLIQWFHLIRYVTLKAFTFANRQKVSTPFGCQISLLTMAEIV